MKEKPKPVTGLRVIAPRHWPTWLGIWCMQLTIRLPYRAQLSLGRGLGRLLRLLIPYRRIIVETNLRLCFPELDAAERRRLRDRVYASLGMSLVETAAGLWAPRRFFSGLGSINGLEHLAAAREQGRGVILLSGHFCSLDFAGRILMNHHPACFTYQELRNDLLDQIVKKARQQNCEQLIHRRDIRGFVKALKAGQVVWYAPDQDPGRKSRVFAPLFGIKANTLTATTKLARLTGAAVMPFLIRRLPAAKGYALEIRPPLEDFPGDDESADARRLNALLEEQIRATPEDYLWLHRRFKTRPEGEARRYPLKPRRARRLARLRRAGKI